MLQGLDQTDWQSFGYHVYGAHDQIAVEIRNLLAEDADVRQSARGFLLGSGQDSGDIYDVTPHIIPFIIELLSYNEMPGNHELIAELAYTAEHILHPRFATVHMHRLCLATYDAFKAGLPVFTTLLKHSSHQVKLATLDLLQYLTDDTEYLIPTLIEHFHTEQDEDVQIALLHTLKVLFVALDWFRSHLRDQYRALFQELLAADVAHKQHIAVARVAVELGPLDWRFEQFFPTVPALLAQEFLDRSSPLGYYEQNDPECYTQTIVQDVTRLEPEPFFELLRHPEVSPEQAHLPVRGLLANAFFIRSKKHWEYRADFDRRAEGMFYVVHGTRNAQNPGPRTLSILQAIVADDKVWEIPTNLFSFFYDLPDGHEALRALLVEQERERSKPRRGDHKHDFDDLPF